MTDNIFMVIAMAVHPETDGEHFQEFMKTARNGVENLELEVASTRESKDRIAKRAEAIRCELVKALKQRDALAEALALFMDRISYNSVFMGGNSRGAGFNTYPKADFDRDIEVALDAIATLSENAEVRRGAKDADLD